MPWNHLGTWLSTLQHASDDMVSPEATFAVGSASTPLSLFAISERCSVTYQPTFPHVATQKRMTVATCREKCRHFSEKLSSHDIVHVATCPYDTTNTSGGTVSKEFTPRETMMT